MTVAVGITMTVVGFLLGYCYAIFEDMRYKVFMDQLNNYDRDLSKTDDPYFEGKKLDEDSREYHEAPPVKEFK